MTFYKHLTEADTVLELFESIRAPVLVIDHDGRVRMINKAAREILGQTPNCLSGRLTCHELLYNKSQPCPSCPLNENEDDISKKVHSLAFKRDDGREVLLNVYYSTWMNHVVLTMHDVTREIGLLREVDLGRKELQAKNYLIERRRQELFDERKKLEQLWNHLPDALLTVDASFSIDRKNKAVSTIFPFEVTKCHQLVGNDFICEGCPAQNGFSSIEEQRKSHKIGDKYVTETITQSPSQKGGMLIFRDTTRQIQLIERIREQQDAITGQNEILSGLVGFSSKMQKSDTSEVADFFADFFVSVLKCQAVAVFINDLRPGNIWKSCRKNISDEDMAALSRAFLSRGFQSGQTERIDEKHVPWLEYTQTPLIGGDGGKVGMVLFDKVLVGGKDEELTHLLVEPFGAYIHNQLLMRQLEERANTDPLTGLFNRGYLEQALVEERAKLKKYNIHHSVVVADVNRLKMVNDVYGHEAGDKLIIMVSRLLKKASRLTDIVARTGGDEFLILLTDTPDKNAGEYIQRLQTDVFADVFIDVGSNDKFQVEVSLGGAGTDRIAAEELVQKADRLMYQAKEAYYAERERYR